jgi:large subunit ribosomal protein L22
MTEGKPIQKEEKKKIVAKPLPVDKEKTREIEEKMKQEKNQSTPEDTKEVTPVPTEEKKEATPAKKESKKPEIKKKEEAIARGASLPISKKHSMYIGSFIKNKKIDDAIADLEKVIKLKKAVPYKGEIPHRKGNMERGRYPVNASKYFINLLKGLRGNVITNQMELDDTRIYLVSASWASRPQRRGGVSAKRTNIIIKAKEFPMKQNKEKKK